MLGIVNCVGIIIILLQRSNMTFAPDIWLNAPCYSCLVTWAYVDNKWSSIKQGFAPLNPYIR